MSLQTALAALRQGDAARCEALCRQMLAQPQSGTAQARLLLGLALASRGEQQEALDLLLAIARAHPEAAHPFRDLTSFMHGRDAMMAAHFDAAARRAPDDADLAIVHAEWLELRGEKAAAETRLGIFLQRDGACHPRKKAAVFRAFALLLAGRNALPQAEAALRHAAALEPGHAGGWTNLANILTALHQTDAALEAHAKASACAPGDPRMRLNLAFTLLKAGRYREGWAAYEARLALRDRLMFPRSSLLTSRECAAGLSGLRILVVAEQGFGDTIQFLRYVPHLAARGARVRLFVPPELKTLAARVAGVELVAGMNEIAPAFDRHIPMMSLPHLLGEPFLPAAQPYVSVAGDLVRHWRSRLPPRPPRGRIGIVWAGASRDHPDATAIDRRRSLSLQELAPLAKIPDISFISLQMGPPASQKEGSHPFPLLADMTPEIRNFSDSAAILATLDALVTVDTSMAHLAGAMGRPVLMLDRLDHCWRWSDPVEAGGVSLPGRDKTGGVETDGLNTGWYPAMRIFRQSVPMNWQEPVHRLQDALSVISLQWCPENT